MATNSNETEKVEAYTRALLDAARGEGRESADLVQWRHAKKFSLEVLETLAAMQKEEDLGLIDKVFERYKALLDADDKTANVTITTAVPMGDELREKARQKAEEQLKVPVYLIERVDPSIIGGVVLETRDKRFDASVRAQLSNIRKTLTTSFNGGEALVTENSISSEQILENLRKNLSAINATVDKQEASVVIEVGDGIAHVSGLKSAMAGELLKFSSSSTGRDVYGLAQNLDADEVGAVLFGNVEDVKEGDECRTTGRVMDIPVGHAMLGRVVNPLGQPIDGLGPIVTSHRRPIEFKAPGIMERQPVSEPVQTGLLAIDAMVPIGRGQRELIIGDRKTGKTAIAIDAIVNQAKTDMVCIYVAIGQKASTVAAIRESLAQHGVLDKTVIVAATAADSAPLQYIAPMAGAAIGEYFMYNDADGNPADAAHPGGHALVIYDDLSKQAVAYRQMSLTLHRPPGREAYPGDIFYLHSRLLERACKLSDTLGGGSLTALPIIETQEGDVSAYIPTNVISITDGQIYLQSNLFFQGQRPAVDVGISVSRVGGAAQVKAMKQVSGTLRLDLASYREKQAFSQFGSDLDATTQYQLNHGAHMMELLKQKRYSALDVKDQIAAIFAAQEDFIDDIDLRNVPLFREELAKYMSERHPALRNSLIEGKLDEDKQNRLKIHIGHFKKAFLQEHPNRKTAADVEEAAEKTDQPDSVKKGQE